MDPDPEPEPAGGFQDPQGLLRREGALIDEDIAEPREAPRRHLRKQLLRDERDILRAPAVTVFGADDVGPQEGRQHLDRMVRDARQRIENTELGLPRESAAALRLDRRPPRPPPPLLPPPLLPPPPTLARRRSRPRASRAVPSSPRVARTVERIPPPAA